MPSYDYIVVGAGAAGSIVAARLIQNGYSIAIVEASGNYLNNEYVYTPFDSVLLWDFPTYQPPYNPPFSQWNFDFQTKLRSYKYPRGTGIGGSSTHHGLLCLRGSPTVYDDWAEVTNDRSWSYKSLLPYFKDIERCTYAIGKPEIKNRGRKGWLTVTKPEPEGLDMVFLKACDNIGMRLNNNPSYEKLDLGTGISSYLDASIDNGFRTNGATQLLAPLLDSPNVKLYKDHFCLKVIIKKGRATGVLIQRQQHAYQADIEESEAGKIEGEVKKIKGNVILCGGTINSPQLLMLSGIGPKQHLEEKGVTCLLDRSGVGFNLQDHLKVSICNIVKSGWQPRGKQATDYPEIAKSIYDLAGKGPLATNGYAAGAEWATPSNTLGPNEPNVHCFHFFFDFRTWDWNEYYKPSNDVFDTTVVETTIADTKGTIKLKTSNPYDVPIIDYNPSEKDLTSLAESVLKIRQVYDDTAYKEYKLVEKYPGRNVNTVDKLKEYIKEHPTSHHACGTCRMGRLDDPLAVVDSTGKVIGLEGLYVIDASIMPSITSQNPILGVYVIAEKLVANLNK
jgi:choline dehydrogenase